MGILETKVKKANGNPTLHYRINQKAFVDQFLRFQRKETLITNEGTLVSEDSITYTTPQTTSINYNNNKGTKSDDIRTHQLEPFTEGTRYVVDYYFRAYRQYFSDDHPNLKGKQMKTVMRNISDFMEENMLDEGNMEPMIDRHFERNHLTTDYNINHFATEGILQNLLFEAGR